MPATRSGDRRGSPWMAVPCEVAPVLRQGLPQASKRVIAAIRAEIPVYGQPLTGEFARVMRGGVEGALQRFVELVEQREGDALGASRSMYYDLGRGEFREGRSLDALLAAYRIGARVAWREIVLRCEAAGVEPGILYQLAEAVFAYIHELSAVSAEGYSAEQAAAAGVTQAARQELVELLTARSAPDPVVLEVASARAGWSLPTRIVAVACPDGEASELGMRAAPRAIGGRIGGFVCVLVPDENGAGLSAVESVAGVDAAVGPAVSPEETAISWGWARRTLRLMQSGAISQRGIVRSEDHLAALLLHGDERLATAIAARWLAPLQDLSDRSRRDLSQTLLAWLAHHGNLPHAAADLYVHPQTVRYRMQKLCELYGGALDDPDARFKIELSLRVTGVRLPRSSATTMPPPSTMSLTPTAPNSRGLNGRSSRES